MKKIAFGFVAVAGLAASAMAQNTGARLTDGTAIFDYTAVTAGGVVSNLPTSSTTGGNVTMNFQIDGAPLATNTRQIFSGNWYYRVSGDTRERHFFNATSRTLTGTNQVDYGFGTLQGAAAANIAGTSSSMMFRVTDTGVDSALLTTTAAINNNTGADLVIDLFFAQDMDLAGTFPNDAYAPLNTSGGNRMWTVTDGTAIGKMLGVGANGAGVGGFSAVNGQMTDTSVDNFIPDLSPGGVAAADNAGVMQWRVTIANGGSFSASAFVAVGRNGVDPAVPAPGALALLGLGGLVATRRRR